MEEKERADSRTDSHADNVQTGDEERREGHGREQQLGKGVVHDDRDGVIDGGLTVAERQNQPAPPT